MFAPIILAFYVAAVAGLLLAEAAKSHHWRWVFKPAASALFVVFALQCGALESAFGVAILAGLIFCAIGDILLIPASDKSFLAGMGAFALGHGAYILAFMIAGADLTFAVAAACAVMAGAGGLIMRWLWPHLGSFKGPVAGYSLIIGAMAMMSVGTLAHANPEIDAWRLAIGAVAFAVSDISVAMDKFVQRRVINRLWGLPLYFGAQIILASSV